MRDTRLTRLIVEVDKASQTFATLNDLAQRAVLPYLQVRDAYVRRHVAYFKKG